MEFKYGVGKAYHSWSYPLSLWEFVSSTLLYLYVVWFYIVYESSLISKIWLCLWCLMPLSTIFPLYRGVQFYWWRKPECPEKTTDLSQVTDKLHHIMLWSWFELTTKIWSEFNVLYSYWYQATKSKRMDQLVYHVLYSVFSTNQYFPTWYS